MGEGNWTDKDWKWLMGILIGIIILILSLWFADNQGIEANFSIMSSAVSIALGLIAIYIALKQDSDSQRLNQQMYLTLKEMENKIDSVDQKVNQLDTFSVAKTLENNMEPFVEELTQYLQQNDKSISKEEIEKILDEKLPNIANNVSAQLNNEMQITNKKSSRNVAEKNLESSSRNIYAVMKKRNDWLTREEIKQLMILREKILIEDIFLDDCLRYLYMENLIDIRKNGKGEMEFNVNSSMKNL